MRVRLMSDVPLGAMLSGGLDSSVIVALMARNMTRPVKTFSVGFIESSQDNELADARLIAERFGTDHHELELSFAQDTVDVAELVWHLDEPIAGRLLTRVSGALGVRRTERVRGSFWPGRGRASRRL